MQANDKKGRAGDGPPDKAAAGPNDPAAAVLSQDFPPLRAFIRFS